MLGFDRHTARSVWTAALVLLSLVLAYQVRKTVFVFILAVLLAYLLSPLVDLLDRLLPTRTSRTAALAIAYVIFVGAIILFGSQVGSRVVEQANALSRRAPELLRRWEQQAPPVAPATLSQQVLERARREILDRSGDLVSALPRAGLQLLSYASNLIDIIIVPVLAFFLLKDGHLIREQLLELVDPGPRRALLDDVMADVHLLLAHYMRALVALSLTAFVCYSFAFSLIGVPYGVLLATTACLLEFIPMLGPLAASVIVVVVAGLSGAPLGVVIPFLIGFRMFQDYVISPQVMGKGVELHPALVLFGVFAGAELAGIPGTFLSVPVPAAVRIVWVRIRKARAAAREATLL